MRGPRVRVRRLAATRDAAPRQVLAGVAPGDVHLLPWHADHLGRHAMAVAHRLGAEVPDARLDVHPPIGLDDEQTVVAGRARDKGARGHTVAANLGSLPLAAHRFALVPAELFRAPIERLLDERARRKRAFPTRVGWAELRLSLRRVDAMNRDLIDAELA